MTSAIKFFVLVLVWAALLSCTQAAPSIVGVKRASPTKMPAIRHSKHDVIILKKLNTTLEIIGNLTQNMKIFLNNLKNGTGHKLFEVQKCKGHTQVYECNGHHFLLKKNISVNARKLNSNISSKDLIKFFYNDSLKKMKRNQHDSEQCFLHLSMLNIKSYSGHFNFTERNEILTALKNDAHELITNIEEVSGKTNTLKRKKNPKKKPEKDHTQLQTLDCNALKQQEIYLKKWMVELKTISDKAKYFIGNMKKRAMKTTNSKSKNTTGTATNRKQ